MKTFTLFLALIVTTQFAFSQQKYAVIINAYAPGSEDDENSWALANPSNEPYYEFWNDVYLMWEMLYEQGFHNDNIFMIYNKGIDFPENYTSYNERYTAAYHFLDHITDYRAYESAVDSVFTGLAEGSLGFSQIQEDDFFVLYIFGHGFKTGIALLPFEPNNRGGLSWTKLEGYLTALNCYKKVIIMQQCFSGSSIEYLQGENTIIMTAANDSMPANVVDTLYYDSISFPGDPEPGNEYWANERERYPNDTMSYRHGEFNLHLFNAIRGIDPSNQSVLYETGFSNFPLINADANTDYYTSFSEAFTWIRTFNSTMRFNIYYQWDDPQLSDNSNICTQTSLMYPTLLHTDIGGDGSTVSHRGLIGISKEIHITSGNQLRIKSNAKLHLLNESNLIVDPGASLVIEDGVEISGDTSNQIIVNGNMQIGDSVTFSKTGNTGYFEGLAFNNESLNITLNHTTFNETRLNSYAPALTITNSAFNDCYMTISHRGAVTVEGTAFNNTWLYLENTEDNNNTATVSNCNFTADINLVAIDLWNYNQYDISNNTINGNYNGIQVSQCGFGQTKKQTITDNTITNCSQKGIITYNSLGSVYRNHIQNNNFGVWFGNNSGIKLYGNSLAESNNQTQEITDNTSYEVYASQYSFPVYFRYNVIIDEDNTGVPGDPLVYYSAGSGDLTIKDVRYNCWGQNFNASQDFYPSGYIWSPIWCPGNNENLSASPDEDMYEAANNLFETENFAGAKSMYELLVNQYPESKFAKAALQELFALEKFATNDYGCLKQYYATNSTIQTDTSLAKLGNYLVSKCDVKLENWPDAIGYCENIIQSPETPEDSIFAIIDLGYVYFVMENSGYKSAFTGKLAQYKPASKEQFIENRNYLLSLIPDDKSTEIMQGKLAEIKEGELLQNVPNPFSGTTKIWYKLENDATIQLNIYNYTGQLVKSIDEGTQPRGTHFIEFDAKELKDGIYLYSISLNGQATETRKMTIMK